MPRKILPLPLHVRAVLSRLLALPIPNAPLHLSEHLARDIGLDPMDHQPPKTDIRHPML